MKEKGDQGSSIVRFAIILFLSLYFFLCISLSSQGKIGNYDNNDTYAKITVLSIPGLWHEDDGFLYDVFYTPFGKIPIQLQSLTGLVPLLACTKVKMKKLSTADICMDHYIQRYPEHVRFFLCEQKVLNL